MTEAETLLADMLEEHFTRGLWADMDRAMLAGHFELARTLSDAAWTMAHARLYRARGYIQGALSCLVRARGLYAHAEGLASGNAVHVEGDAPTLLSTCMLDRAA